MRVSQYMIDVLKAYLKDGEKERGATDPREAMDNLHRHFHLNTRRNSERAIPVGAARSSLLRDT